MNVLRIIKEKFKAEKARRLHTKSLLVKLNERFGGNFELVRNPVNNLLTTIVPTQSSIGELIFTVHYGYVHNGWIKAVIRHRDLEYPLRMVIIERVANNAHYFGFTKLWIKSHGFHSNFLFKWDLGSLQEIDTTPD
jgi:hypothetical protein